MTVAIPVLTVRQVAEELQVHPNTVYRLFRRRLLKRVKIGRANRVRRSDLERYLSRSAQ